LNAHRSLFKIAHRHTYVYEAELDADFTNADLVH